MTDPGVPHDDMLSFLWRSRMDIPQIRDEALDALLAQDRGPGEDAAPLREAPSHGELTGLDPVLAEFRGAGGMPDGFHRSRRRRPALLRTLLSVKVAGTVAATVLGGGGKVAAYCASAPRPGAGTHGTHGKPASYATGRATSRPGHTPAGKHKGKAASR
jgi:hypothetical protein